jgi:hypothetical protein
MAGKAKRKNIYFRQTEREFRAQKLSQIIQHFRTNIPYKIYNFSKKSVKYPFEKIGGAYNKFNTKLPKSAKKSK